MVLSLSCIVHSKVEEYRILNVTPNMTLCHLRAFRLYCVFPLFHHDAVEEECTPH